MSTPKKRSHTRKTKRSKWRRKKPTKYKKSKKVTKKIYGGGGWGLRQMLGWSSAVNNKETAVTSAAAVNNKETAAASEEEEQLKDAAIRKEQAAAIWKANWEEQLKMGREARLEAERFAEEQKLEQKRARNKAVVEERAKITDILNAEVEEGGVIKNDSLNYYHRFTYDGEEYSLCRYPKTIEKGRNKDQFFINCKHLVENEKNGFGAHYVQCQQNPLDEYYFQVFNKEKVSRGFVSDMGDY